MSGKDHFLLQDEWPNSFQIYLCLMFRGGQLFVGGGHKELKSMALGNKYSREKGSRFCERKVWNWVNLKFFTLYFCHWSYWFCLSPICTAFRLGLMSVSSKCLISSVKWKGQQILLLMPETQLHKMQIMSWGHWWTSWMESKGVFKYMLCIQFIGLEQEWGRGENSSMFLDCYWDFQISKKN